MELRPEIVERIQTDHTFRNGRQFVGGGWPPYDKIKKELLETEAKNGASTASRSSPPGAP
jgi:hypothetical protein